jgi:5-hydroxyisourate hydrolase
MSSPLTTHVLDTARGKPAVGMHVVLHRRGSDGSWIRLAAGTTNPDGRVNNLIADPLVTGTYRLTFDTGEYFERSSTPAFYPHVEVTFTVSDPSAHYHVPLLLSPFGYSTYRGS